MLSAVWHISFNSFGNPFGKYKFKGQDYAQDTYQADVRNHFDFVIKAVCIRFFEYAPHKYAAAFFVFYFYFSDPYIPDIIFLPIADNTAA